MANTVRLIPARRVSRAPLAATTAANLTMTPAQRHPATLGDIGQRGDRTRQPIGSESSEGGNRNQCVEDESDRDGEDHGPRDRSLGHLHFLPQSADPGVAGEGKEDQSSGLEGCRSRH